MANFSFAAEISYDKASKHSCLWRLSYMPSIQKGESMQWICGQIVYSYWVQGVMAGGKILNSVDVICVSDISSCRPWAKSIAPSKARRSLFSGTDEIALIRGRRRRRSNDGQLNQAGKGRREGKQERSLIDSSAFRAPSVWALVRDPIYCTLR